MCYPVVCGLFSCKSQLVPAGIFHLGVSMGIEGIVLEHYFMRLFLHELDFLICLHGGVKYGKQASPAN